MKKGKQRKKVGEQAQFSASRTQSYHQERQEAPTAKLETSGLCLLVVRDTEVKFLPNELYPRHHTNSSLWVRKYENNLYVSHIRRKKPPEVVKYGLHVRNHCLSKYSKHAVDNTENHLSQTLTLTQRVDTSTGTSVGGLLIFIFNSFFYFVKNYVYEQYFLWSFKPSLSFKPMFVSRETFSIEKEKKRKVEFEIPN